ncbi:cyclophilin-like domain-containing protein, partial [Thamnocephalis sphaerospora]
MSVLIETSLGDLVIDLEVDRCPRTCLNFVKLCKIKYYNFCAFFRVEKDFAAQTGDPTGTGQGGESVFSLLGKEKGAPRYFPAEIHPRLKHTARGTVSMAVATAASDSESAAGGVSGSQFFITLADGLDYLDGQYTVFGQVVEGLDVLDKINDAHCDDQHRPYRDIRIRHTILLDDPFPDPNGLQVPDASPVPTAEQLATVRLAEDESLDDPAGMTAEELAAAERRREAQARALTLEMVGDLPFADIKPPEDVLFICKLNPVTRDEDLELIFSRFGTIASCEVIRDRKTGESLCYAFVEFENREHAEEAYFKMDNVLVDDRRIKVDFSQSVSKLHGQWAAARRERSGGFGDRKLAMKRQGRADADRYEMVFDTTNTSAATDHARNTRSSRTRSRSRDRSPDRRRDRDRRSERDYGRNSYNHGDSGRHHRSNRYDDRSNESRYRDRNSRPGR